MSRNIIPKFKLWLSLPDCEGVFGDGKWRLLKAIEETGSLSAAALSLGISYRKAWGDLKKAETRLQLRLIERYRGGISGGGTVITPEGQRWLKAYETFHVQIEHTVREAFSDMMRQLERTGMPTLKNNDQ